MTYIPKRNNKAINIGFTLIFIGIALFAASRLIVYPAMFQLVAFAAIIGGIFFLTRYVLAEYKYILDAREDGTFDLVVVRTQGKKAEKVCHLSSSAVTKVAKGDEPAKKAIKRYNYTRNIATDSFTVLFDDGGKASAVILEYDERFFEEVRLNMTSGITGEGITFAM